MQCSVCLVAVHELTTRSSAFYIFFRHEKPLCPVCPALGISDGEDATFPSPLLAKIIRFSSPFDLLFSIEQGWWKGEGMAVCHNNPECSSSSSGQGCQKLLIFFNPSSSVIWLGVIMACPTKVHIGADYSAWSVVKTKTIEHRIKLRLWLLDESKNRSGSPEGRDGVSVRGRRLARPCLPLTPFLPSSFLPSSSQFVSLLLRVEPGTVVS